MKKTHHLIGALVLALLATPVLSAASGGFTLLVPVKGLKPAAAEAPGLVPQDFGPPPTGCSSRGDVCDDGSIYVSSQFVAASAAHTVSRAWSPTRDGEGELGTVGSLDASRENLAAKIAHGGDFPAALYCATLSAHGHGDWMLPGNVSAVLFALRDHGAQRSTLYWTSHERSATQATRRALSSTGGATSGGGSDKATVALVACVRQYAE
ncbi:hypothetical protein J2T57_001207 [Natronocella acetinitrilica]|uniref:DUF1566 domain-containing protein n=1 Tax=Natronocella acetinitrilica TaxID=414046 RepID=A0AAE3KAC9_9GAMM|nr:hypothetical protein [Natronocella acetinitrilica]MCP1674105.1 hypothetical protein [Natronocella acetinitrilica]